MPLYYKTSLNSAANRQEIQQHFISIPPLVSNVTPGIWKPFGANQWG